MVNGHVLGHLVNQPPAQHSNSHAMLLIPILFAAFLIHGSVIKCETVTTMKMKKTVVCTILEQSIVCVRIQFMP